jgi:hypothetical protein
VGLNLSTVRYQAQKSPKNNGSDFVGIFFELSRPKKQNEILLADNHGFLVG